MLIHKETFFQPADDGIPSHWVVQYWENNPGGFPEASYFESMEDATEFEETLTIYDDWFFRGEHTGPIDLCVSLWYATNI